MRYCESKYKRYLGEMTRTYTRRNDKHPQDKGVRGACSKLESRSLEKKTGVIKIPSPSR
jgi:hypothetical protein